MGEPRTLVLGAGHVGTFAIRALASAGAQVVAADADPAPGFLARFGPASPVDLVELDLCDDDAIRALLLRVRPAVVVHCAGVVGEACARDPELAWRVNVDGARTVGQAAVDAGASRLVYLSSLAVYGRPARARIREDTPLCPLTVYGRTKAAAEEALGCLHDQGLDVTVLRPCGTFGPVRLGRGSQSARLIERALLLAVRGREVRIEGGDGAGDELLYVKDLGRAIALAACAGGVGERVLNVGTGRHTGAEALGAALRDAVPGTAVSVVPVAGPAGVPEAARPTLDVSRIRDTVGFVPGYQLAAAFRDYLEEADLR